MLEVVDHVGVWLSSRNKMVIVKISVFEKLAMILRMSSDKSSIEAGCSTISSTVVVTRR